MKLTTAIALALGLSATPLLALAQTPPAANPNAPQNSAVKSPRDMKPGAPAAGHNSFTMSQAKGHIEKSGYTDVMGLAKDKDGLWQGKAVKDGKSVGVSLDYQGNVTSK